MRVLVIGAGKTGATVIEQLRKNPDIATITVDPREETYALEEKITDEVDIQQEITPITLEHIIEKVKPHLVLLTMSTEDMGLGKAPGVDILADSLKEELASISGVPVIEAARSGG